MKQNLKQQTGPRDPWTVWRERPAAPDDVCRALANGSTLKQWTQSYNFDYFEVAHWLLDNPTRAYNYERSLQIYAHYLRDEIIEIADDSSQDLITDAKGKTTLNHAHFRRQGRQIEARKAIIRQITAGKKPLKDQEPPFDRDAELLKLGMDDEPYDPQGLLKGYKKPKPEFDPGPPPLSAATRQLGAAPGFASPRPLGGEGAQRAGEGVGPALNTTPLKTDFPSPSLRPLERGRRSAEGRDEGVSQSAIRSAQSAIADPLGRESRDEGTAVPGHVVGRDSVEPCLLAKPARPKGASQDSWQLGTIRGDERVAPPTTNHEQPTTNQPTFPSFKAYLRAIRESNWIEGQPLPFTYRPTPAPPHEAGQDGLTVGTRHVVGMASKPSPSAGSASASEASISEKGELRMETQNATAQPDKPAQQPTTNHEQQTTNQPSKTQVGRILPKVDWFKMLGIQKLGAFFMLFCLLVTSFVTNLQAVQPVPAANPVATIWTKASSQLPPATSVPISLWIRTGRRIEGGLPLGPLYDRQPSLRTFAATTLRAEEFSPQYPSECSTRHSNPPEHSRRSRDALATLTRDP